MLKTTIKLLSFTAIALTLSACKGETASDAAAAAKAKAAETAAAAKDNAKSAVNDAANKAGDAANKAHGSGTKAVDGVKDAAHGSDTKAGKHKPILKGELSGRNDHVTTGRVGIVKTAEGYKLHLGPNFSLDGAPDPIVALGNNGTYDPANKLGVLKSKTGKQSYAIPANLNPADFSEAYIWCEKFNVSLGTAKLEATGYGSK